MRLCATGAGLPGRGEIARTDAVIPQDPNPRLDRVAHELRATGAQPKAASPLRTGIHSRGYLPHVKREGAAYFVTFRLADSLPTAVLTRFLGERAERLRCLEARQSGTGMKSGEDAETIERDYRRKVERFLDSGCGECWLGRAEIADVVADSLRFFDGQRYQLQAWVVMPNHVHAVFWPLPNFTVSGIVQSWKRHTARHANELLGRIGQPFWQRESFDHWIRDEREHARCRGYTVRNPVLARLCREPEQWRWSSAWQGDAPKP